MNPSDPALQSLLLRIADAIQKQPIPQRRASWRMRWTERFVNFAGQPGSPKSIADCRKQFLAEVASTQSATPWLLQEIEEAIRLFVSLAEPAELSVLLQRQSSPHEPERPRTPSPHPISQGRPVKLIDQIRGVIRAKHYSRRTEEAYIHWARQFILFHDKRHPLEMGEIEVASFLEHLAVNKAVAASTQNQALNALVFLYATVLQKPFGKLGKITRAKRPQRLPSVLSQTEIGKLFDVMQGSSALMARLLYGAGLRLTECVNLRVKDINFETNQILIRDGKGFKDRMTMLPEMLKNDLAAQIKRVKQLHDNDLKAENGHVTLPYALSRKYPNLAKSWHWQYVFPAGKLVWDGDVQLWRARVRYSNRASVDGTQGRKHNDDLHSCPQETGLGRQESARSTTDQVGSNAVSVSGEVRIPTAFSDTFISSTTSTNWQILAESTFKRIEVWRVRVLEFVLE
jgi:integron integrase